MKYRNGSDFLHENLILRRMPTTQTEAYNKLVCLRELELKHGENKFVVPKPSKRKDRIFKMYWSFGKMGIV